MFEHATCRGSSAQDEYTYMGNGQCADARGIVPNYAWKNHTFDGGTLQGGCFALCKRLRGCIGFHLIFAHNTCGVYSPAFGPGVGANGWPGYSEMSESPSATEIASTYTGQSSEYMCYKLTGPASWSVSTWIKLDKYAWADKAPQVVHDSLVILSDRKTEPRYLSIENGYMVWATRWVATTTSIKTSMLQRSASHSRRGHIWNGALPTGRFEPTSTGCKQT